MCGIIGEFRFDENSVNESKFTSKLDLIRHRGPDGDGVWSNEHCFLGHVRLAIIDLSENGSQPMKSPKGNIISFNGEIYNFKKLREKNVPYDLRSESDTEVLLHLLDLGDLSILNELIGMFSFAYFDNNKDELLLVRDHLGIKPLYYHVNRSRIVFCSEIKGIVDDDEYQTSVNESALKEHYLFGFSHGEETIFNGIKRLEPGHLLRVKKSGVKSEKYFNFDTYVEDSKNIIENVDATIEESVKLHSVSDVKLGMMLSGGIDSTLLLKYLEKTNNLGDDFIAFNAGLDERIKDIADSESLNNERDISQMICSSSGVKFEPINVTPESFISVKDFITISEEPICNPAGFLIDQICQKAQLTENKVLFSGHGGDEVFAGYRRHAVNKFITDFKLFRKFASCIPMTMSTGSELFRILYALKNPEKQFFSLSAIGLASINSKLLLRKDFIAENDINYISDKFQLPVRNSSLSTLKKAMLLEINGYLSSQNLMNVDKFSMKNSIEVRVPFLNLKLFKQGYALKDNQLIKNYKNKSFLRKLAAKKLPKNVYKQRKTGFGPSLSALLASDEVVQLLTDSTSVNRGIINKKAVSNELKKSNKSLPEIMQLLNIAFIEQWFRTYID